jgi:hypothetical protein
MGLFSLESLRAFNELTRTGPNGEKEEIGTPDEDENDDVATPEEEPEDNATEDTPTEEPAPDQGEDEDIGGDMPTDDDSDTGDAGGDAGTGDTGGDTDTGEGDSGSDDSDSTSSGDGTKTAEEIEAIEKELFSDLTDEQLALKHVELKSQFIALYEAAGEVVERINKIPKTDMNIKVLEFIGNKLTELRSLVHYNLTEGYETKSYVENVMIYQRCLVTMNTINQMLQAIIPPDNPET